MRYALIGVLCFCGCTGGGVPGVPQSRVTDEMREACYWLSDTDIEQGIYRVEVQREEGWDELDLLQAHHEFCVSTTDGDSERLQSCNTCGGLMVESVYD